MTVIYDPSGRAAVRADEDRICLFCGCTDDRACPGGCSWSAACTAEVQICTACELLAADLGAMACMSIKEYGDRMGEPLEGGGVIDRTTVPCLVGQQLLIFLANHELGPRLVLDRWRRIEGMRGAPAPAAKLL